MSPQDKLDKILAQLEFMAFPDEATSPDEYWNEVEIRCDNATDFVCDTDLCIKDMIAIIKS